MKWIIISCRTRASRPAHPGTWFYPFYSSKPPHGCPEMGEAAFVSGNWGASFFPHVIPAKW